MSRYIPMPAYPDKMPVFIGSSVEVRLYQAVNGSKGWVGTLTGYEQGQVTIESAGKTMVFEKSQVAQVRLHIVF